MRFCAIGTVRQPQLRRTGRATLGFFGSAHSMERGIDAINPRSGSHWGLRHQPIARRRARSSTGASWKIATKKLLLPVEKLALMWRQTRLDPQPKRIEGRIQLLGGCMTDLGQAGIEFVQFLLERVALRFGKIKPPFDKVQESFSFAQITRRLDTIANDQADDHYSKESASQEDTRQSEYCLCTNGHHGTERNESTPA